MRLVRIAITVAVLAFVTAGWMSAVRQFQRGVEFSLKQMFPNGNVQITSSSFYRMQTGFKLSVDTGLRVGPPINKPVMFNVAGVIRPADSLIRAMVMGARNIRVDVSYMSLTSGRNGITWTGRNYHELFRVPNAWPTTIVADDLAQMMQVQERKPLTLNMHGGRIDFDSVRSEFKWLPQPHKVLVAKGRLKVQQVDIDRQHASLTAGFQLVRQTEDEKHDSPVTMALHLNGQIMNGGHAHKGDLTLRWRSTSWGLAINLEGVKPTSLEPFLSRMVGNIDITTLPDSSNTRLEIVPGGAIINGSPITSKVSGKALVNALYDLTAGLLQRDTNFSEQKNDERR